MKSMRSKNHQNLRAFAGAQKGLFLRPLKSAKEQRFDASYGNNIIDVEPNHHSLHECPPGI